MFPSRGTDESFFDGLSRGKKSKVVREKNISFSGVACTVEPKVSLRWVRREERENWSDNSRVRCIIKIFTHETKNDE